MTEKIHAAMEECQKNAPLGARALRSLMLQDPKSFLYASVYRGNVLVGDDTAHDVVHELIAATPGQG